MIVSYNFIRFFEIKTDRLHWFKNWFFEHKNKLIILVVLAIILLGYITFFSNFNLHSIIILFPFFFMTLFYVVPLFKIGKIEISFRNFPAIKIFSIVIAWVGITVFFPLFEVGYQFNFNVYVEFVQRLLFLIALILPFDIRDVNVDSKLLKTIPQLLGVTTSKIVGYVLLIVFVVLEFSKEENVNSEIYSTVIIALVTIVFLRFSYPEKKRYYTSLWVEAIPILWLILFVLFLKN